jgi:uncharacterized lipoprotein NlpE involved in copper resistance
MKLRKIADENKQAEEAAKKAAAIAQEAENKVAIVEGTAEKAEENKVAIKSTLDQEVIVAPEKLEGETPIVRKVSTSDDELIEKFFKTVEF